MEKINIAEILKYCPKGMELDCTMFYNVKFDHVDAIGNYPIAVTIGEERNYNYLTEYGEWNGNDMAKCVIYPKGKTTWEGFVPPCNFKDGDVIYVRERLSKWVSIFKEDTGDGIATYADYCLSSRRFYGINDDSRDLCQNNRIYEKRLATEEEKQKLFKAIKDNGYRWNAETKTLEKEEKKDKFDIRTLNPFDKVLTRDNDSQKWGAELFSFYDNESEDYRFQLVGIVYARYCIPFVGNEHLLGTTDDCDEYYKTWL